MADALTRRVESSGNCADRPAYLNNPADDFFSHIAVREEQGRRPGGFGLLIAKKLVDELIYNEQGKEVLLIKYLDQAAPQVA